MWCTEIREKLPIYVDGGLDDAERGVVEAHLRRCVPCNELVERLRHSAGLLRGLPAPALPPGLRDRVLSAPLEVTAEPTGPLGLLLRPVFWWAAAAALLLALTGSGLWRDRLAAPSPTPHTLQVVQVREGGDDLGLFLTAHLGTGDPGGMGAVFSQAGERDDR